MTKVFLTKPECIVGRKFSAVISTSLTPNLVHRDRSKLLRHHREREMFKNTGSAFKERESIAHNYSPTRLAS